MVMVYDRMYQCSECINGRNAGENADLLVGGTGGATRLCERHREHFKNRVLRLAVETLKLAHQVAAANTLWTNGMVGRIAK